MQAPDELRYTAEHEWAQPREGDIVRVGLTDFAQRALGDVVYVELPELGREVVAGDVLGEVESTKSVSEVYAPLAGRVVEVNALLVNEPGAINSDPYGAGWLCALAVEDPSSIDALLDAVGYGALIAAET